MGVGGCAERVIRFNQDVRGAGPGEFFDDGPWSAHYFVIGSERGQNWFYHNLASGSEAVGDVPPRGGRATAGGGVAR